LDTSGWLCLFTELGFSAAANLPAFCKSTSNQDAQAIISARDKDEVFAGLALQACVAVAPMRGSGALSAKPH
jgi:hypothetical protein